MKKWLMAVLFSLAVAVSLPVSAETSDVQVKVYVQTQEGKAISGVSLRIYQVDHLIDGYHDGLSEQDLRAKMTNFYDRYNQKQVMKSQMVAISADFTVENGVGTMTIPNGKGVFAVVQETLEKDVLVSPVIFSMPVSKETLEFYPKVQQLPITELPKTSLSSEPEEKGTSVTGDSFVASLLPDTGEQRSLCLLLLGLTLFSLQIIVICRLNKRSKRNGMF
ncbi:hypothetical protein RyT2_15840 [Pseudolactococcus yaeyamensis]